MRRTFRLAVLLLFATVLGCKETVLHSLDESRANQISILLERAGIDCNKRPSGSNWDLQVASADASQALQVIDRSRILTRGQSRFKVQDSSFLPDDNQQLQASERQLAWSIEETLERIPGVVEAKVHLWLNKPPQLGLKAQDSAARSVSALLLTEADVDLNNADDIKILLRGATGAPTEAISVVARTILQGSDSKLILPRTSSDATGSNLGMNGLVAAASLLLLVAVLLAAWIRKRRSRRTHRLSPAHIQRGSPLNGTILNGGRDARS